GKFNFYYNFMKKIILVIIFWGILLIGVNAFANPIPDPTVNFIVYYNNERTNDSLMNYLYFDFITDDTKIDLPKLKAKFIELSKISKFNSSYCDNGTCFEWFPTDKPAKLVLYFLDADKFFISDTFSVKHGNSTVDV